MCGQKKNLHATADIEGIVVYTHIILGRFFKAAPPAVFGINVIDILNLVDYNNHIRPGQEYFMIFLLH